MTTIWAELGKQVEFRDLEFFVRVYEHVRKRHTSEEAGEALGIDKSFLLRKIAEVEQKLHCQDRNQQLIERESGRLWDTCSVGDEFYQFCVDVLSHRDSALQRFVRHQSRVTIGVTHAVLTFLLPQILRKSRFLQKQHDIDLHIVEGEWHQLVDLLYKGPEKVDFAIGPGLPSSPKYTLSKSLRILRRGLAVPKHHRCEDIGPEDLSPLSREVLFCVKSDLEPGSMVEKELPEPVFPGRRIILPNYADIKKWVEAGLGLGVLYDWMVLRENDRKLQWIDLSDKFGRTATHVYYPAGGKDLLQEKAQQVATLIEELTPQIFSDYSSKIHRR